MKVIRSKIAARLIYKIFKNEGILSYDIDNCYPQRVLDIVNASGVGKNCINTFRKFIEGAGFKDKTFYKNVINNKGLTADKLLRFISKDLATFGGFAIHVQYNGLLQISEITTIPFMDTRIPAPDNIEGLGKIVTYYDWSRRIKERIRREDIIYIDKFTSDQNKISEQIQKAGGLEYYKGQIFWYSNEGENYPLAPYDAVLEDLETDGRIKNHKRKKAATGFNSDYAFIHKGKFESEEQEQEMIKNLEEFQGDESAGNIMLVSIESEEQKPELLKFDKSGESVDFYTANELSVHRNIRKAFGLPSVLAMEDIPGSLGLSTQMKEAYHVYNSLTTSERTTISENMKILFSNFHTNINPSNDYDILPLEFQEQSINQPLAVQFGVGGTQAIKEILVDALLTPAQKVNSIIILFGLTLEQANSMVYGSIIPNNQVPE